MPDTTNYMILGYSVTMAILLGIVVYLVVKARGLRSELRMLETLDAEDHDDKASASSTSGARETLASQTEHPNLPA